jgi:hypothetical protein
MEIKKNQGMIQNPLVYGKIIFGDVLPEYSKNEVEGIVEPSMANIWKYYRKLFILTKLSNKQLPEEIFKLNIRQDIWDDYKSKLILVPVDNLSLIKVPTHYDKLMSLDKDFLEQFNHFDIELSENNLILPILMISYLDLKHYIDEQTGLNKLKDFFKVRVLNNYFNIRENNFLINRSLVNFLKNLNETRYWECPYNTLLTMDKKFEKRMMNWTLYYNLSNNNISSTISKMKDFKPENDVYLSMLFNNKNYVTPVSKVSRFRLYRKSNKKCEFTNENILEMYNSFVTKQQRYYFLTSLLTSKEYCHLFLNNPLILDEAAFIINENIILFRYLIQYAWLCFYMEETITKTWITNNDRFVFDLDTAAKLPVFPILHDNPHLNPYVPILVSEKNLDGKNNINGLPSYSNNIASFKLATTEIFKRNLNIFMTGRRQVNLFEGLTPEHKIYICGSAMSACIQEKHPLTSLFVGLPGLNASDCPEEDQVLYRTFNEIYATSDIDIVSTKSDSFEFIESVEEIFKIINGNVIKYNKYAEEKHQKKVLYKKAAIFVDIDFISKFIVTEKIKLEYILNELKTSNVNHLFYPFYVKKRELEIANFFAEYTQSEMTAIKEKYKDNFKLCDVSELKVMLTNKKGVTNNIKSINKVSLEEEEILKIIEEQDQMFEEDDDEESESSKQDELLDNDFKYGKFIVKEDFKYKITSPHLNRTIEIFRSKYPEVWSIVGKFHLPCVRCYYDFNKVYLLPSCITSHLTFMNIDYKYFAGSCDPAEILLKNLQRGWGTYLNLNEISHLIKYISEVDKWKNLIDINIKSLKTYSKIRGSTLLSSKLFRPRLYNSDFYYEAVPVDLTIGYNECIVGENKIIDNERKFKSDMMRRYPGCFFPTKIDMLKFTAINNITGKPQPIKKWVIDAFWNLNPRNKKKMFITNNDDKESHNVEV